MPGNAISARASVGSIFGPINDDFCAQLAKDLSAAITILRRLHRLPDSDLSNADDDIAAAERLIPTLPTLSKRLEQARQRATKSEIAQIVTLLCGAYPNAESKDLRVFARLACEDIGREQASRYALSLAAQRLRQVSKWLPSISEILEEVRACELSPSDHVIQHLETELASARKFVESRRNEEMCYRARRAGTANAK